MKVKVERVIESIPEGVGVEYQLDAGQVGTYVVDGLSRFDEGVFNKPKGVRGWRLEVDYSGGKDINNCGKGWGKLVNSPPFSCGFKGKSNRL